MFSRSHVRVDNCSYVDGNEAQPTIQPSSVMGFIVAADVGDCASFTLNYDFSREAALGYDSTTLAIAANAVPDLSFLTTFPSLTSLTSTTASPTCLSAGSSASPASPVSPP